MMPAKAFTSILHINSVADGRRRFNARPHAFVSIAIVAPAGSAAQVTVVTRAVTLTENRPTFDQGSKRAIEMLRQS